MNRSDFDPISVKQGSLLKAELEETPSTMTTENGADSTSGGATLDAQPKTQMAGPKGQWAMARMTDPQVQMDLDGWLGSFYKSGPGMQWMMAANPAPPQEGA